MTVEVLCCGVSGASGTGPPPTICQDELLDWPNGTCSATSLSTPSHPCCCLYSGPYSPHGTTIWPNGPKYTECVRFRVGVHLQACSLLVHICVGVACLNRSSLWVFVVSPIPEVLVRVTLGLLVCRKSLDRLYHRLFGLLEEAYNCVCVFGSHVQHH